MDWRTELQDASFRGVKFDFLTLSESGQKTQVIQQSPYSDNAQVDDMGNEPMRLTIRAIFSGSNYSFFYDAFKTAVLMRGDGEFIHPTEGIKRASVENYNFDYDPSQIYNGLYADVTFIVADIQIKPLFVPVVVPDVIDVKAVILDPATAAQEQLDQLKKNSPNDYFSVVTSIRNKVSAARRTLGLLKSNVNSLLSPPEWAFGLVDDVTSIATFDITDISALQKWRSLSDAITRIGTLFDDGDEETQLVPALGQLWRATTTAASTSAAQAIVQQNRTAMAAIDQTNTLTPNELATVRQQVRNDLQGAIAAERDLPADLASGVDPALQIAGYKQQADEIHLQIQQLIEVRPPLITITVTVSCTLHWLAHSLYGDFSRADELKRLNPTLALPFLQPGMELTAYAR